MKIINNITDLSNVVLQNNAIYQLGSIEQQLRITDIETPSDLTVPNMVTITFTHTGSSTEPLVIETSKINTEGLIIKPLVPYEISLLYDNNTNKYNPAIIGGILEDEPIEFTEASEVLPLESGDKLGTLFSKIKSWLIDLMEHTSVYEIILNDALDINPDNRFDKLNTRRYKVTIYGDNPTANVPDGCYVGIRELDYFDENYILVTIKEMDPRPGRIWYNQYNKTDLKWTGWITQGSYNIDKNVGLWSGESQIAESIKLVQSIDDFKFIKIVLGGGRYIYRFIVTSHDIPSGEFAGIRFDYADGYIIINTNEDRITLNIIEIKIPTGNRGLRSVEGICSRMYIPS